MNKEENLDEYKSAYEKGFKFFDENHWYLQQYAELMCGTIKQKQLKTVLSLGIGHNVVSNALTELLGITLTNYDIVEGSPEIIADFKKRNGNTAIELFESYFEQFSPARKYDAIEMGFVLEHVDDPLLIVNRFKNFLAPGGIIFIAVPNARSLHRLIGHKAGLLHDMYQLGPYDLELGHKRYFDLEKITGLAQQAGLTVITKKGLMLKPVTGAQIKALGWDENIISALMQIGLDYPEIANCMYLETSL